MFEDIAGRIERAGLLEPLQAHNLIYYSMIRPRENMVGVNMVLAEYHQNTLK